MKWNWPIRCCFPAVALTAAAFLLIQGCRSNSQTTETDQGPDVQLSQAKSGTPQPGQRLFASPEQAACVLKDAVAAKDRRTLVDIFGQEGKQLIFSGDRVRKTTTCRHSATI